MAENKEIGFSPKTQYLLLCFILTTHSSRKNKNHKGLPSHDKFLHRHATLPWENWKHFTLLEKKVETVQKSPDTTNSLTQRHDIIQKKSLYMHSCPSTPFLNSQASGEMPMWKDNCGSTTSCHKRYSASQKEKTTQEHTNCFFITRIILQLNLQKPVMKKKAIKIY